MTRKIAILFLFIFSFGAIAEDTLTGRVLYVMDGDTFRAKIKGGDERTIRISCIDAPEKDQFHGITALDALEAVLKKKRVFISPVGTSYGRTVASVSLKTGESVGVLMAETGYVWADPRYCNTDEGQQITEIVDESRENKIGLFDADPKDVIAPWDWRDGVRPVETVVRPPPVYYWPPTPTVDTLPTDNSTNPLPIAPSLSSCTRSLVGCCSTHGGVSGATSDGGIMCSDGTKSASCRCS
jgi:endonuclease YncB( thermonuclease family)